MLVILPDHSCGQTQAHTHKTLTRERLRPFQFNLVIAPRVLYEEIWMDLACQWSNALQASPFICRPAHSSPSSLQHQSSMARVLRNSSSACETKTQIVTHTHRVRPSLTNLGSKDYMLMMDSGQSRNFVHLEDTFCFSSGHS